MPSPSPNTRWAEWAARSSATISASAATTASGLRSSLSGATRRSTTSAARFGQGRHNLALGELDPDDQAGAAVERQQDRPAAAGRGHGLVLVEQPLNDQAAGDIRDRGQAQVRGLGDVGARDRALVAHQAQHQRLVDLADQLAIAGS